MILHIVSDGYTNGTMMIRHSGFKCRTQSRVTSFASISIVTIHCVLRKKLISYDKVNSFCQFLIAPRKNFVAPHQQLTTLK